jgi:hypothetical protein
MGNRKELRRCAYCNQKFEKRRTETWARYFTRQHCTREHYFLDRLKIDSRSEKKCSSCGEVKPISEFYYKRIKRKSGKVQISNSYYCKSCDLERRNKWNSVFRSKPEHRYDFYKRAAKKRNLEFKITFEEFKKMIYSPCYFCGEKPSPVNGVDRYVNKIGYLLPNCVPCCIQCNRAKNKWNGDEFILMCKKIVDRHIDKSTNGVEEYMNTTYSTNLPLQEEE